MGDIKEITSLFEYNHTLLRREFAALSVNGEEKVCAAYFTSKRRRIHAELLSNTCFLLKDRCGQYSALSGNGLLASASILCTEDRDIETRIEELGELCRDLGAHREGQNITASAVFLAEAYANPLDWMSLSSAIRTLRHEAISNHPGLGELDRTLCTAFVLSGEDPDALLTDATNCLAGLNGVYGSKTDNTRAACMLALCQGPVEEKLNAIHDFTDRISRAGAKVSPFCLPELVSLLCSAAPADVHSSISALSAELKRINGFGIFSLPGAKRLSLAILAAATHTDKKAELLALDKMFKTL